MAELIPIFRPRITGSAMRRINKAMRSGWISEGSQVKAFEEGFCSQFNLPRALAVNSGTAALHLALLGLGVGPGDEVLTTAQTFVATSLSILHVGATPVFADLKPGSANLDPLDLERRIGPKTKAILLVHYGGYPCDMDEIRALARAKGLALIEDAAHALGASYKGASVGSLGDAAIFSFQAIKSLSTGDGGMVVFKDEPAHRLAYRLRWFGIDRDGRRPSETGGYDWDIRELGYKYHMNDLAASLGLGQLESYPMSLERRRQLDRSYRSHFASVPGVKLLEDAPDRKSACWLFTLLVDRRLDFIRTMEARGIQAGVWHTRIDKHPIFGGEREDLPRLEAFNSQQVSIPLRDNLSDDEVARILKAVKLGW